MNDPKTEVTTATDGYDDIIYPSAIPFVLVHLACIGVVWTGVTWQALAMCAILYWLRIFAIGAGYHRYFAHRAYATSRALQFVLAVLSQSTAQKSVLWWAAKHRHHHLHSDTEGDVHSPRHKGFFYSHVAWLFDRKHDKTDLVKIADFACYPELMWLHRYELMPALILALLCFVVGGWPGLVVGFFWSPVLVYHATFCINSLAHVHGRKRYVTADDSRNNWFLAIFTMGEGWHNNHHACQSSVRQGFRWWDRLGSRVINRAAAQLAATFNADRIAIAIGAALEKSSLSALQGRLSAARHRGTDVLANLHLPHLPSRNEILARATAMFAMTPSIEDIVDRAHEYLLEAIGAQLCQIKGLA